MVTIDHNKESRKKVIFFRTGKRTFVEARKKMSEVGRLKKYFIASSFRLCVRGEPFFEVLPGREMHNLSVALISF